MKKRKGSFSTFILIVLLITGLSFLLYPTVSDYWNTMHQSRVITKYSDDVAKLDETDYSQYWSEAIAYNNALLSRESGFALDDALLAKYEKVLDVNGSGIMGYIEIPSIGVYLPIYHGTEERVLQVGVGHLDWSSLPTGGAGTHCLLSAHRGLPSARLFTDLDQVRVGECFMVRVLNELLTYEVDQILIVEPTEVDAVWIQPGKDLCTLITCTPYGVNSHRLLVRGHRVENTKEAEIVRVVADAVGIDPLTVALVIVGPILLLLLIVTRIVDKTKKKRKKHF